MLENLLDFFVTSAHAAAPSTAPQSGGGLSVFLMIIVFLAFFYFTVSRPQSKRAKEHKDILSSLAKGDEVLSVGGIIGKVVKVTDNYVVMSVSDTVDLTMQKSSISTVLPKGTLKSI